MTADLDFQLARYTAAVSDEQLPITSAEARELLGTVRELPEVMDRDARRLPRRPLVAAAAAVMIVVLVGGIAWLASSDESAPPAQQPTETTNVGSWRRVPLPFSVGFWDVAQTPYGLVAYGNDGLWISEDGTSWAPFARETDIGGGLGGIASSELGTVVIGFDGAWFSPDGENWTLLDSRLSEVASIPRVAVSPNEFVAITADIRFWVSGNGVDWQEVAPPNGSLESPSLAATPFGFFAATGFNISYSPDGRMWNDVVQRQSRLTTTSSTTPEERAAAEEAVIAGLIQTYADSLAAGEWDYVYRGPPGAIEEYGFDSGRITDIAGSSRGVVAVTAHGRVFFSPDGVVWQTSTLPGTDPETLGSHLFAVGASDTGFLIVTGAYDDPDTDFGHDLPGAWYSEDGLSWTLVPHDSEDKPLLNEFGEFTQDVIGMRGVVPLGTGFLVVGEVDPDLGGSPVWIYDR